MSNSILYWMIKSYQSIRTFVLVPVSHWICYLAILQYKPEINCLNRFLSHWKRSLWISFAAVWTHTENLMVWVWWCMTHTGPTDLTAVDSAATCAYITESLRKARCHDNIITGHSQKPSSIAWIILTVLHNFFTRFRKRSAAVRLSLC